MKRTVFLSFLPVFILFAAAGPRQTGDDFNWQTLGSGMLTVHWYEGDLRFGQEALEAGQKGLTSVASLVPLSLEQPVEIFIYASADDLHAALSPRNEEWVAGHASPELGVLRVLVEPGPAQGLLMEQRIPHELMHIMLYRQVGAGYRNVPVWLREGMATLAEMYPNPEYERVLRQAAASDRLIPLQDLCVSFPEDTALAFLAYAESRSFVDHLQQTYGSSSLMDLARSYADGVDCGRGTERLSGVALASLEAQWRGATLGEKTLGSTMRILSPYLVLLCLVLILPMIGIAGALRKGTRHESGTSLRVK